MASRLSLLLVYLVQKPYNTGQGMKALCKLAEERGIDIYYGTPGEQLVQDETGRVIGVIAKSPDGYIQLNGSKALSSPPVTTQIMLK